MDALLDEVESLEAILMEDVRVERNEESIPQFIETTVFPLVGEDTEQQYVCVTLQVLFSTGYPDVSPDFKLLRPRGLDDHRLASIKAACDTKLQDSLGFPVVFDLIEVVREHLSGSNLPSGQCVVCLYGFCDGDEFTRTECFHYLHSYCLGRHLNAMRRNYQEEFNKLPAWQQKTAEPFQALCPVCREPIKDDSDSLRCAMPPSELENAPDFRPTQELRQLQQRMSALFLQQKSRGAIIDIEAESGAVISIESEEDIRRRLQRKQQEESLQTNSLGGAEICDSDVNSTETGSLAEQQKDGSDMGGSNSTNFAPVVQQTQRIANDPTNNNYHHNRRYFKGGRRHHHHHHHQQTQRERERFEHHHIPSSSTCSSSSTTNNATSHSHSSGSQPTSTTHANSKQAKAHTTGHAHNR
ncbi:E3 ubiquitin-protein ligase RNF25 [Glossina fuscipes fuscipes]